jgi:hypothetical protein
MAEDSTKKRAMKEDDRNLVVVDEDFAQADAEDRLWLFWERNKTIIVRGITSIVLGVLAFLAFYFWQQAKRQEVGDAYNAARDASAKRSFAAAHPRDPLAVVALLEVADELRQNKKFVEAAKTYDEAIPLAQSAENSPLLKALATRARLYAALTRLDLGEKEAETSLASIAEDKTAPDTLRGYAMIILANTALNRGDSINAAKWINLMDKRLLPNHVWTDDKNWLVRSEPSLLNPPPAPSAEKPAER